VGLVHGCCHRLLRDTLVSLTNDVGERDENSKVKIKVSGCFRTQAYGETYARISNYMQSMTALGYNPLVAIEIALAGQSADMVKQHDGLTRPEA